MASKKRSFSDILAKRRTEDAAVRQAMIRAGVKALPLGSSALEIIDLFKPSIAERRTYWLEELDSGLRDLEERFEEIDLRKLAKDPNFVTTVLHASVIAERNHRHEKIEALRNATLSAALPNAPEDSLQQMFLSLVDTLTVVHLRLLKVFHYFLENSNEIPQNLGIDPETRRTRDPAPAFMEQYFTGWKEREAMYQQFWKDLYLRGLVRKEEIQMPGINNFVYLFIKNQPSALGKQFLSFIENPLMPNERPEKAV